jgi:hypothetical protein
MLGVIPYLLILLVFYNFFLVLYLVSKAYIFYLRRSYMKRLLGLFCVFCIISLFFLFSSYNNNPYSGTYFYSKNNNLSIFLNKDDTFSLNSELDKFYNSSSGKYTVKDNKLTLKFNNELMISNTKTKLLSGMVQGSKVTFKTIDGYFLKDNN